MARTRAGADRAHDGVLGAMVAALCVPRLPCIEHTKLGSRAYHRRRRWPSVVASDARGRRSRRWPSASAAAAVRCAASGSSSPPRDRERGVLRVAQRVDGVRQQQEEVGRDFSRVSSP